MSISIAHINIRSLFAKFGIFQEHVREHEYDVIGISESWLHPGINSDVISLEGYNFYRQDRTGRGGGVGVYVREGIRADTVQSVSNEFIECIWICVSSRKGGDRYILGNIYRPPKSNFQLFVDYLEDILFNISASYNNIVICGDFNLNMLDINSSVTQLLSVCNVFGLNQLIQEPTRITATSATLLDLIFATAELEANSGVTDVEFSDHGLVYAKLKIECERKETNIPITYRSLRSINLASFDRDVQTIRWHNVYEIPNIEAKIEFLNSNIINLFDKHAPVRTSLRPNKKYCPWITDNIKLLQELRDKAHKKYKTLKTVQSYSYYKELRNFTTVAIRNEKKAYLRHIIKNSSSKDIWSEFQRMNITKKKHTEIPSTLSDVHALNDYFVNSVGGARQGCSVDNNLLSFYNDNRRAGIRESFTYETISDNIVFNIIKNMKSKSAGSDGLNVTMLLLCCPHIVPFITHILNECISVGSFPRQWKSAICLPLPKKKNPVQFGDLRSISILPVFSKILEKAMELQLRPFLDKFDILPKFQSGFRKGYSCATALSCILDNVISACDGNKVTVLISLDYSKAFDMIDHKLLISILHYIGLENNAIKLVSSFLSDRIQQVKLNNKTSTALNVTCGVPQGSILGPILYAIYTCNFHTCLSYCGYHYYADDTQIYHSFDYSNINASLEQVNRDISALVDMSKKHSLQINPSKSCIIVFGSDNVREAVIRDINICVNDVRVPCVESARILGLTVDSKLRFSDHINTLLKRAYASLKCIFAQRHILDTNSKRTLCDSLVLSTFNHCDVVYGPCLGYNNNRRIQKVQNSCLRLIHGIRRRQRVSYKLKDTKWLNMYNRRKHHMACFFHKIVSSGTPPYLLDKLQFRTDVHNINIRRISLFTIPKHRTQFFERAFSYVASTTLNNLGEANLSLSASAFRSRIWKSLFREQSSTLYQ